MATAGNMPTYSSVLGPRAARISAMPYMRMANRSAAARNQNTRLVVSYCAPRSAEVPISRRHPRPSRTVLPATGGAGAWEN